MSFKPRESRILTLALLLMLDTFTVTKGMEEDPNEIKKRATAELIEAAQRRKPKDAWQALERGADPNARDQGVPVLHRFLECLPALLPDYKLERIALVKELLRRKADPNARACPNTLGRETALHVALFWGADEVLHEILACGANPNARVYSSLFSKTPLYMAVRDGRVEAVRELLQYGANPAHCDEWGETVLQTVHNSLTEAHTFAKLIRYQAIKLLLLKALKERKCVPDSESVIKQEEVRGFTLFQLLPRELRQELLWFIQGYAAYRQAQLDKKLIGAVTEGNITEVELALMDGADPDTRVADGAPLIAYAAALENGEQARVAVVGALLRYIAEPNPVVNGSGQTLVELLRSKNRKQEIIDLIIKTQIRRDSQISRQSSASFYTVSL
jgi:ankyrin repeat protein